MMSLKYQYMSDCLQAHYSADRIENTIKGKNILAGKSGGLLHRLCQGQWGHMGRDNGTEVFSNPQTLVTSKWAKRGRIQVNLYHFMSLVCSKYSKILTF